MKFLIHSNTICRCGRLMEKSLPMKAEPWLQCTNPACDLYQFRWKALSMELEPFAKAATVREGIDKPDA